MEQTAGTLGIMRAVVMVRQEPMARGVCRVPCQQLSMLLQCCFAGGA